MFDCPCMLCCVCTTILTALQERCIRIIIITYLHAKYNARMYTYIVVYAANDKVTIILVLYTTRNIVMFILRVLTTCTYPYT